MSSSFDVISIGIIFAYLPLFDSLSSDYLSILLHTLRKFLCLFLCYLFLPLTYLMFSFDVPSSSTSTLPIVSFNFHSMITRDKMGIHIPKILVTTTIDLTMVEPVSMKQALASDLWK